MEWEFSIILDRKKCIICSLLEPFIIVLKKKNKDINTNDAHNEVQFVEHWRDKNKTVNK